VSYIKLAILCKEVNENMTYVNWKKEIEDDEDEHAVMECKTNVELVMTKATKDKLDFLCTDYSESEIGGFLTGDETIDKDGNVTILIDDLLIPYQEAGTADVDVDGIEGQLKLRQEYGDRCSKIIGHYHSHHSMGAFFSSTDKDMMKQYSANKRFCIFIVSSEGDHLIRLVLKNKPYEMSMENVPYKVEIDSSIKSELLEEIQKKVKVKTITTKTYPKSTITSSYDYKNIKKEVSNRIKYYQHDNHTVKIENIYEYYADLIAKEFEPLKPTIDVVDKEHSSVTVILGDKNKAKEFMWDVKAFLIDILYKEQKKLKTLANEEKAIVTYLNSDKDELDDYTSEFNDEDSLSGRCNYNRNIKDDYNTFVSRDYCDV